MAVRVPLVLIAGEVQELPSTDLLDYAPLDENDKVPVANLPDASHASRGRQYANARAFALP